MSEDDNVDLQSLLDEKIIVHLKGGRKLKGTLSKYDDYMNLVLKKVEEYGRENDLVNEHELVIVKGGNARTITKSN